MTDKEYREPEEAGKEVVDEPEIEPQEPEVEPKIDEPKKIDVTKLSIEEVRKLPQVSELIQQARSQEKAKLYKSIENKDAEIERLQAEVSKLSGEIKTKENENLSEVEILQKEINKLRENQEELEQRFQAEREAEAEKRRSAELAAYKERRLREEGEELVSALVGGSSEEEIDDSIDLAKQEYSKIVERTKSSLEEQAKIDEEERKQQRRTSTPKVTNPSTPSEDVGVSSEDIKKMTPEEWAKVRDKAKRAALEGKI